MVPMALIVAAWLLASRSWRGAGWWLALFGLATLLVVSTKIAYIGWGIGVRSLDFTGISGHGMTAAATLTVAGFLAGDRYSKIWAAAGVGLGALVGLLIAASRVILGFHSPAEVIAGCSLGFAIAMTTISIIRANPRVAAVPSVFVLLLLMLVVAVQHGRRAPTEHLITKIALYLSGRSAPFYN